MSTTFISSSGLSDRFNQQGTGIPVQRQYRTFREMFGWQLADEDDMLFTNCVRSEQLDNLGWSAATVTSEILAMLQKGEGEAARRYATALLAGSESAMELIPSMREEKKALDAKIELSKSKGEDFVECPACKRKSAIPMMIATRRVGDEPATSQITCTDPACRKTTRIGG